MANARANAYFVKQAHAVLQVEAELAGFQIVARDVGRVHADAVSGREDINRAGGNDGGEGKRLVHAVDFLLAVIHTGNQCVADVFVVPTPSDAVVDAVVFGGAVVEHGIAGGGVVCGVNA